MDTRTISRLAGIMAQYNLTECDIEEEGLHVRLARQATASGNIAPAAPIVVNEDAIADMPADNAVNAQEPAEEKVPDIAIISPLIGIFYNSSAPGTAPYVKEGTHVKAGQTVCIIEAMKVMNEIKAEHSGVITKVYLDNKTPVQYGTVLFDMREE